MSLSLASIPATVRRIIQADALCRSLVLCDACNTTTVPIALDELATQEGKTEEDEAWRLVYDVMRVHKSKILFLNEHLHRVASSYETVTGHAMPSAVQTAVREALQSYASDPSARLAITTTAVGHPEVNSEPGAAQSTDDQNVKLVMWLPPHASGDAVDRVECLLVLFFVRSFFPPESWYGNGVASLALLYHAVRASPNAKVVQAALRARAKQLQDNLGVFEVLLVHGEDDGYLMPEGSRSNYLLLTHDNRLLCSTAADILPGITLSATLQAAEAAGLGIIERRRLGLRELCAAKSYIMLGTSVGPLPVGRMVLYYDTESKRLFERMAAYCQLDVGAVPHLRVLSAQPPQAVLEFDAHNGILRRLKEAYDAAAFA